MTEVLTTILYTIYCAIFPYFVSEEVAIRPEPEPWPLTRRIDSAIERYFNRHPKLARVLTLIYLNYYLPIFHPVFWWRVTKANNELLEELGWFDDDIDIDL
jgi:hypothetical protein